jgi:crotonyl-CoA carboxylase/reductase
VVSSADKIDFCLERGAIGCVDRSQFDHWGPLPHWSEAAQYTKWLAGAKAFGRAVWEVVGERRNPRIVVEHPGEATLPTSIFLCETGGMVVICGGSTGFAGTLDLRYLWMRQKRLQGSHAANLDQAAGINGLVESGQVKPVLSQTFGWEELARAHQLMSENRHSPGNMAVLVNAARSGEGVLRNGAQLPHLRNRPGIRTTNAGTPRVWTR